jgi:hypothetical protein
MASVSGLRAAGLSGVISPGGHHEASARGPAGLDELSRRRLFGVVMMRISKLPPDVIDRLDAVARHADALVKAATQADAKLAECRATLAGNFAKTGITRTDRATVETAQREFAGILEAAQETRRRADAARRVASSVKAFVDGLPDDAAVELAAAPQANGVDLGECRGKIAGIRAKIAKLRSAPLPSDRGLVENFIDELRKPAREQIEQLVSRWPHFASTESLRMGNDQTTLGALLAVMAPRADLANYLCAKIDAKAAELGARPGELAALESELAALQSLEAMFVNAKIESGDSVAVVHSPEAPAPAILGITVVERGVKLAS